MHKQPTVHLLTQSISTAGFSLIEVLVSMALLAILSGIGISIFGIVNNSYSRADAISRMQSQGQQTLESMERSIRSASASVVDNGSGTNAGCSGTDATCLVYLSIPSSSIEYQLNGLCDKTVYKWTAPTSNANGQIVRYSVDKANASCGTAGQVPLFDGDVRQGVSVERTGSNPVFSQVTGTGGIPAVSLTLNLYQGVGVKPAGTDTRANVPLRTTVGLRAYGVSN